MTPWEEVKSKSSDWEIREDPNNDTYKQPSIFKKYGDNNLMNIKFFIPEGEKGITEIEISIFGQKENAVVVRKFYDKVKLFLKSKFPEQKYTDKTGKEYHISSYTNTSQNKSLPTEQRIYIFCKKP